MIVRAMLLCDEHPHTKESIDNLMELYEAWNKPEQVKYWRAKLPSNQATRAD
jgi:hypothetical protein